MKAITYGLVIGVLGLLLFPHWGQAALVALIAWSVVADSESLKRAEAEATVSRAVQQRLIAERRLQYQQRLARRSSATD